MNKPLADAAVKGVTNPAMERVNGFCCRFVRQVVTSLYGGKYRSWFGASAIETCDTFVENHAAAPKAQALPLQVGDILFKRAGAGQFGHVAVFVGMDIPADVKAHLEETAMGYVAENSSTSKGRIQGAKGYRTLEQFGVFDFIGRLAPPISAPAFKPAPKPPVAAPAPPAPLPLTAKYFVNGVPVGKPAVGIVTINGLHYVPAQGVAQLFGVGVHFDETKKLLWFTTENKPTEPKEG